jgi:hypothetical protein
MAKFDRLIVLGEQQAEIDANAVARVVIMLARRWLRRSTGETQQADNGEVAS